MNTSIPFRYHLFAYRREQLILPAALWALCALIVTVFRAEGRAVDVSAIFLGMLLPMMGAVLSSSALIGDPTLELQFATQRPSWRSLLERLGLLFVVIVIAAILFQVFLVMIGVDISALGNWFTRQLVWVVPTLFGLALATLFSVIAANGTVAVMITGLLWVFEIIFKDWFLVSPWAHNIFWFMHSICPDSPDLLTNQLYLLGLTVVCMLLSSWLLRKQERYI